MSEVAKLNVVPIDRTGRPQQNVIDAITDLLARAKVGEIQSIAYAYARSNNQLGYGTTYGECPVDSFILGSALLCLQHDYVCKVETEPAEPPLSPDEPA